MAWTCIQEIEKLNKNCDYPKVEIFVAPYEADPQLAWLYNNNWIDIVMSDDADLLLYVDKVICKYNKLI